MFEPTKPYYMTRAVSDELADEHKQFILQYIQDQQEHLNDYFQVFDFYIENDQQWLIQKQEQPERETTIFVELKYTEPIDRTVWVMDQVDHVMLLFPEDY